MFIAILPNPEIARTAETAELLAEKLAGAGIGSEVLNKEQDCGADMIISIGGDGTYLHTTRYAVKHDIPVLGMNMGRLGFLTQFDFQGMDEAVSKLKRKEYTIEERFLAEIQVYRGEKEVFHESAFNDLVIHRDGLKLLDVEIHVDSSYASSFYGDGLIVATPTGSTAYSLSAGGPIVEPESDVMLLTPVCPHSISSRPMVVSGGRRIRIRLNPKDGVSAVITADGEPAFQITDKDQVLVQRSEQRAKVVKLYQTDFYKILREKFL